jgi:hypothetical protein
MNRGDWKNAPQTISPQRIERSERRRMKELIKTLSVIIPMAVFPIYFVIAQVAIAREFGLVVFALAPLPIALWVVSVSLLIKTRPH